MQNQDNITIQILTASGVTQTFTLRRDSHLADLDLQDCDRQHFFFKGKELNKYLSLDYQEINDGDVIIAMNKRKTRKRNTLATGSSGYKIPPSRQFEASRISDMVWKTWEMSRNHNSMINHMLKKQRELLDDTDDTDDAEPMDTSSATEISCEPLPVCFDLYD